MKKISILLTSIFLFSALSCSDFGELNTDPNNPLIVPAHLLLGNIVRLNQNAIYGMQQGGDMGMCWAQHVSKVQYNDEERYIPRRTAIDIVWDQLYTGVIADSKRMYELADGENNTNLMAISLILQANAFQILTDLYGPIPFKDSFVKGTIQPKYDAQEVVYDGILGQLTEAEALLAAPSGTIVASSDVVFGGNIDKWRKFGNSLKLKALMRIVKKKPSVAPMIASLVTGGNLMTSTDDSAQLVFIGAIPDANPIFEFIIDQSRAEYKISNILVDKLIATNDPRLAVIAQPKKGTVSTYVGNPVGIESPASYNDFSSFGTKYLAPTLPGVILSFAQVQFMLAEAANEGYISGGLSAALNYYNSGIAASFNFNGVTGAAAFSAQTSVLFTTQVDAREKIATQNWIALFGQGFEAWTEWRRTRYPVLVPVSSAVAPVLTIPTRLFYQQFEASLNGANNAVGVGQLNNGDKLTSKLWWDVN